jgi:hypothetical protein
MLCVIALLAVGSLYSFPAHAVTIHDSYPEIVNPSDNVICPIVAYNGNNAAAKKANREQYGIMKRMVMCVQGLVIPAAYQIMYRFATEYLYLPIATAMMLAVVIWGYLMTVGKNSAPMRDAFIVALKIGSVSLFSYVLGKSAIWPDGLFPVMLSIVDWLCTVVTTYLGHSTTMKCAANFAATDVWGRVDCALNSLIGGIFNPAFLIAGLVGFFLACFLSGTFGIFIALVGAAMFFYLIIAVLRATYITISAYVALALMAIISPIFITMILFKVTYGYFEKWLKLTIGFMLQPMFLFAYLSMMLAAFDTVVYDGPFSIYRAIISPAAIGSYPDPLRPYPPQNVNTNPDGDFMIGTWMMNHSIYRDAEAAAMGVGTNPRLQKHVASQNIGIGGTTGTKEIPVENFKRKDAAGMAINVIDNFQAINVYKVDLPVKKITWQELALWRMCDDDPTCNANKMRDKLMVEVCGDMSCDEDEAQTFEERLENVRINYLIGVFLSMLIALLTLYIFYLMLDKLPFIGAGIGGEKNSMPVLGEKGISMPGNKLISKMKKGMGQLAGGGG